MFEKKKNPSKSSKGIYLNNCPFKRLDQHMLTRGLCCGFCSTLSLINKCITGTSEPGTIASQNTQREATREHWIAIKSHGCLFLILWRANSNSKCNYNSVNRTPESTPSGINMHIFDICLTNDQVALSLCCFLFKGFENLKSNAENTV